MAIKTVDGKGRLALGREFANEVVEIDDSNPNQVVIRKMVLIPADEAWLYKNSGALKSVRRGLQQAVEMKFSEFSPDVDSVGDELE